MLNYESQEMARLKEEYNKLVTQRDNAVASGAILKGSEAYQAMTQEIQSVQQAIEESATATVELNNAIRDLNWEIFDYIEERIGKITEESNFLIDLLDNQSLFNDNGSFNDKGESAAYLHGKNAQIYAQQVKDYADEIKKVNADLAKDPSNKDLIERREELLDLQQESISNIYAEKEAVKSLVEEGIAKHLESLSELIDKYKNAMNSAKDLFEYQENISQQTEEISRLQKILKSYEGMDDTEESRKSIQEYQNQLKDAEQNLAETEWDRYIAESEELLTDLYDDYSETLNARLDNIDALFTDVINDVNSNASTINNTIQSVAKDVGYSITLLDQTAQQIKNTIQQKTVDAVASNTATITNTYTDGSTYGASTPNTSNTGSGSSASSNSSGGAFTGSVTINNELNIGEFSDIATLIKELEEAISDEVKEASKSRKFKGFAKGSRHISKNQWAWTQENATELIYRSSDGAILTPLSTGDMVFTHEMSENLWKIAQGNLPDYMGGFKAPTAVTKVGTTSVNNQNTISITLPNVTNYNEFKNALQKDSKFVGFMQEVTLGQAIGKNKLNKNKY